MYSRLIGCFGMLGLLTLVLTTAPAPAEDAKLIVKVLAEGLVHPTGIAVHPKTGELYVCEAGSGRVIRLNPAKSGAVAEVVTGFKLDLYGKGPKYEIGPLGLMFHDADTLLVGGGDLPDGQELVRAYKLDGTKTLKSDAAFASYGPVGPGEASKLGEGNFYAFAADSQGIYVSSNGDDTKGWILKLELPLKAGMNQKLQPYIATKEFTETINAPVGLTTSPKGSLMVGQMGAVNTPKDSWLLAYSTKTGKPLTKAATGLNDIAGLAYSPKSGKLYCVDFAWLTPKEGGVFRLDYTKTKDGKMTVTPVKIHSLEKPTALAFGPDGTLYVTVNGAAAQGSKDKTGQVVVIQGDL